MELVSSDVVQLEALPPGLRKLKIEGSDIPDYILALMLQNCTCLEELSLSKCSSLKSLPQGCLPATLKKLSIRSCPGLEFSTILLYTSLEMLSLVGSCHSLQSFPLGSFPKLNTVYIFYCQDIDSFTASDQTNQDLTSLKSMHIFRCPNLFSFPQGGLSAPNLTWLWFYECNNLKSLPENMHSLLPSLEDSRQLSFETTDQQAIEVKGPCLPGQIARILALLAAVRYLSSHALLIAPS
ncbi:hypothetical protein POUND7_019513 [Theobroma cacao]